MTRHVLAAAIAVAVTAPLVAQAPAGWKVRVDRSTSASDPDAAGSIQFMQMGGGFHAVTPQAGVFWNPSHTATGTYAVKGTFTLNKPSGHTNYYGLVFGGSGLEGPQQNYLYFLVAQDGTWLIKKRESDAPPVNVAPKTANAAVKRPDATGTSTNTLEVRVKADAIDYIVNGTIVHTTPKAGLTATTDGIYGFRINHLLDVMVADFAMTK